MKALQVLFFVAIGVVWLYMAVFKTMDGQKDMANNISSIFEDRMQTSRPAAAGFSSLVNKAIKE